MNLIEELQQESPVRRMAALQALGDRSRVSKGDRWALRVALAEDPSPIVRHEVAFLLSRRDIGEALELEALLKAASDPSILVRHEVALSLGSFPTAESKHALQTLARDPEEDVRLSAIHALEQLRSQE